MLLTLVQDLKVLTWIFIFYKIFFKKVKIKCAWKFQRFPRKRLWWGLFQERRLQCEDSNFITSRLNQRFSSEYAPKISCFKKNKLRKKSAVSQSFSKFLTCDPVVHSPQFNQKRSSCKIFQKKPWKNLNVVMGKTPLWKCSRCRVYPSNFNKN